MGRPKGELRVGGVPILAYLLDRFQWAGPTLLVTAPGRERPAGCEQFDREVTDPTAGEGPLRGVLTALEATETEILVVATCDMPLVRAHQLTWLVERLTSDPASLFVMVAKRGVLWEPFPFAIRTKAYPVLRDHFAAGGRSLDSLTVIDGARYVPAPADWHDEVWTNLNTPADLATFLDQPGVS